MDAFYIQLYSPQMVDKEKKAKQYVPYKKRKKEKNLTMT